MATLTSRAATITTVNAGGGEDADWSPTGGTLAQAFGASSDGTSLYASADIDPINNATVSTYRLKFTGFDFSAIPTGSTINSVTFGIRARTAFAVLDTVVLPDFGGGGGGNLTHVLKFYNSSGGATINQYSDAAVCQYRVRTVLSNSAYALISEALGSTTDGNGHTSNAVSFFTLNNVKSAGLTMELGFYDETQSDEVIRISAYDVFITVDYTAPNPPGSFTLTSPTNGQANIDTTALTLSWTEATGFTTYTVVVSENADLSTPEIEETGLTDESLDLSSGLPSTPKRWYWQVTAINGVGSTTSSIFSFTTLGFSEGRTRTRTASRRARV